MRARGYLPLLALAGGLHACGEAPRYEVAASATQGLPRFVPEDTAAALRQRIAISHARMPKFAQYPASDRFVGSPAPVDLSSAEGAQRFRTVLRDGAAAGPNFAGHYTVVMWGCGSPCQSFAIVDARTGRVQWGPHSLTHGAAFRPDSELFIANPPESWREAYGELAEEALGGLASATYYRWNGEGLVPLDSLAIGTRLPWARAGTGG